MVRLEDDQVPAFLSIMIPPHQPGVPVMLAAARPRIQGLPILHPKQRLMFSSNVDSQSYILVS
jgi:hypothetical protein